MLWLCSLSASSLVLPRKKESFIITRSSLASCWWCQLLMRTSFLSFLSFLSFPFLPRSFCPSFSLFPLPFKGKKFQKKKENVASFFFSWTVHFSFETNAHNNWAPFRLPPSSSRAKKTTIFGRRRRGCCCCFWDARNTTAADDDDDEGRGGGKNGSKNDTNEAKASARGGRRGGRILMATRDESSEYF